MSKVTLPKEVGEAIEDLRGKGIADWNVITIARGAIHSETNLTIKRWAFGGEGGGTPDLLMQALVNGYEVEKTPEDNLREYYGRIQDDIDRYDYGMSLIEAEAKRCVVNNVLRILGITIEGINE